MFLNTFQPSRILVLARTTGAGGAAPPSSTKISVRMKRVQKHVSRVDVVLTVQCFRLPRPKKVDLELLSLLEEEIYIYMDVHVWSSTTTIR